MSIRLARRALGKLSPEKFCSVLKKHDINFYTGVPDSLLKDFCAYMFRSIPQDKHVITANEGSAVGLAAGHYLSTKQPALVYLQNSGFGNTINPLLSLCHKKVYGIPMLLLIGWRAEPGVKDEPQHIAQGALQEEMLKSIEMPTKVLPTNIDEVYDVVRELSDQMKRDCSPCALVVKKGTFDTFELPLLQRNWPMSREDVVKMVADAVPKKGVVVSTTGMCSRELFEHRAATTKSHERDFLTVGGMGHAASIAIGLAMSTPERRVLCLDGDGAFLMHMGVAATVGQLKTHGSLRNFTHIVINNAAHDSVGGQPTAALDVQLSKIADACSYRVVSTPVYTKEALQSSLIAALENDGPTFLEICVRTGARDNLGRPTRTPKENKADFMNYIHRTK